MADLLRSGAVFLHIPKTGGDWVSTVLHELDLVEAHIEIPLRGDKHITLDDFGRLMQAIKSGHIQTPKITPEMAEKAETAFLFCFVRHPLKWFESWFSYMAMPERNWRSWGQRENALGARHVHPCAPLNGLGAPTFSAFMRNVLSKRPGWVSELFSWYTGSGMRFVGRQERLAEDLITALQQAGCQSDADQVRARAPLNTSDRRALQWERDLIEETLAVEGLALRRYGYGREITVRDRSIA